MLPISPRKLLIAMSSTDELIPTSQNPLIRISNLFQVQSAKKYIYPTNTRQEKIVRKWLIPRNSVSEPPGQYDMRHLRKLN